MLYRRMLTSNEFNADKLIAYGFENKGEWYEFSERVMDGAFNVAIRAKLAGNVEVSVVDKATGEEYAPAYVRGSVGEFVGKVCNECELVLQKILDNCSDATAKKGEYAAKLLQYVAAKYGTNLEHLWEETPHNAILRCAENNKWYAALLLVEKKKLGFDEEGTVEIINVKAKPEVVAELVDSKTYFPAYHMNKKHWMTMKLDGSVSFEEICERVETSYELVSKKK